MVFLHFSVLLGALCIGTLPCCISLVRGFSFTTLKIKLPFCLQRKQEEKKMEKVNWNWLEEIHGVLLTCKREPIQGNVSCVGAKNVDSVVVGWNVL